MNQNQPQIIIEAQTPKLGVVEPIFTERSSNQHDDNHHSSESIQTPDHENGSMSLDEHNNSLSLGNKTNGGFLSNTYYEGSDDDRSQLTNSNSINNHGDQSNDSISDSQSTKSSERTEVATKKLRKQKKKNRISQMIAGVSHKSKSELFQKLFKNMAPDELLINDYSCALQRDILVHGRLYLSQTWLCFYANIFGWETLVTIRWVDITAITKEKTAKLIPNAIQIFTDTDKYFFSTFVTREHAYTALFRIWQNALLGQPMLPADLKNICKRRATSRGETREGTPINDEHIETGDEMLEYEDDKSFVSTSENTNENENNMGKSIDETCPLSEHDVSYAGVSSPSGSPHSPRLTTGVDSKEDLKNIIISVNGGPNESIPINGDKVNLNSTSIEDDKKLGDSVKEGNRNTELSSSSPLPNMQIFHVHGRKNRKAKRKHQRTSYPPYHLKVPNAEEETTTDNDSEDDEVMADHDDDVLCPCHDNHKGSEYINEEFNFDVDALYEHLFSQDSDMMKTVFSQRKFQNTKYTPYKREDDGSHSQILAYTIPLNYSIGPKQCNTETKHIMPKENIPGSSYVIKTESTTAGIPYGDSFYVGTQYCITRASGNRSRLRITSDIVYTKRVFGLVKNMISRGSDEAFKDYTNFLLNVLKSESDLLSYKNVSPPKPKLAKAKSNESSKPSYIETRKKSIIDDDKTLITSNKEKETESSELKVKKSQLSHFAIVFVLLFVMNVYMLSRLRSLEKSVLVSKDEWLPDHLPSTKEEWNYLLDYQKSLHELELIKLKEVIGNTASLLEQVQLSMRMLYNNIEKNIDGMAPTRAESKHINSDVQETIKDAIKDEQTIKYTVKGKETIKDTTTANVIKTGKQNTEL